MEKIKWNLKIYPLGIMKTPLLQHLKQIYNNLCINEDLGLQTSLIRLQGWNFSQVHEHTKI